MTFREFESACEQSNACNQLTGLPKMRCVRECVSPSCYRELYQFDQVLYILYLINIKKNRIFNNKILLFTVRRRGNRRKTEFIQRMFYTKKWENKKLKICKLIYLLSFYNSTFF